ncbi:hypothetical protein LINGRAHAP2_LOCUS4422 [Linum grandiflorum]
MNFYSIMAVDGSSNFGRIWWP